MSKEYDNYLREHKQAVNKGLVWLKNWVGQEKLKEILPELKYINFETLSYYEEHDWSKTIPAEYPAYDRYFYGEGGVKSGDVDDKVQMEFDYAWLHHVHNNPHHWQYWVLFEDDPLYSGYDKTGEGGFVRTKCKALEIPDPFILEMICDWWSFSWRKGDLYEIFNWWNAHDNKILLGEKTRLKVEKLLRVIYDKLNEVGGSPEDYEEKKSDE